MEVKRARGELMVFFWKVKNWKKVEHKNKKTFQKYFKIDKWGLLGLDGLLGKQLNLTTESTKESSEQLLSEIID